MRFLGNFFVSFLGSFSFIRVSCIVAFFVGFILFWGFFIVGGARFRWKKERKIRFSEVVVLVMG